MRRIQRLFIIRPVHVDPKELPIHIEQHVVNVSQITNKMLSYNSPAETQEDI